MDSLSPWNRLVKLIARAFYDDVTFKGEHQQKSTRSDNRGIAVVVLDALTRRQWVREEDLAKDLKLHGKQLRRCLRFFEEEKLITREHRKETAKGAKIYSAAIAATADGQFGKEGEDKVKLHTQSYCCLDYAQIYDVVRYRLYRMRKKLKDEVDKKNTVQEYICPNCSKRYSDFDAPRLISFVTGCFHCENCNHELVKEADKFAVPEVGEGDDTARRRHEKLNGMLERMNVQLKPLMEQLNRVKDLGVPEFGNLQAWEARANANARANGGYPNDSSMSSQGYGATPMPYLGDPKVEVSLTGVDVKDEDTKSEAGKDSLKVLPPWMIREGMKLTKEQRGEKSERDIESSSSADLKDDKKTAVGVEDQKSFQAFPIASRLLNIDEYVKAYYAAIFSRQQQLEVNNEDPGPSNEAASMSLDRQVGMKSTREEDVEEEDDVEWAEEAPISAVEVAFKSQFLKPYLEQSVLGSNNLCTYSPACFLGQSSAAAFNVDLNAENGGSGDEEEEDDVDWEEDVKKFKLKPPQTLYRPVPSMAKLKADSPISHRIVTAFLDFLNSVDHAGSDAEAVEVAKECLTEAFKIDPSAVDRQKMSNLMVEVFKAIEENENQDIRSAPSASVDSSSFASNSYDSSVISSMDAAESKGGETASVSSTRGLSKDDLFAQFIAALETAQYFKQNVDGHCDSNRTDKATQYFHDAINDMERGSRTFSINNLAESLKSQGNKDMQSKAYHEAIELYSCAIALNDNNAVYYCNRAAAFTHIRKYSEAVKDCLKSIEIDPNYSKAYSRLGLAYYGQGNYGAAISEGFGKALQLDPDNEPLKENIRVTEQKLNEAMQRAQHYQNYTSASFANDQVDGQQSMRIPPMSFDASRIPVDVSNIVSNISANLNQHINLGGPDQASNGTGFSTPDINSGSFNVNLDGQMPQDLMRSVMNMFSGAGQQGTGVNNPNAGN
ncbi:unnamed protein product [Rhodiola kirilowii]